MKFRIKKKCPYDLGKMIYVIQKKAWIGWWDVKETIGGEIITPYSTTLKDAEIRLTHFKQ